MTRGKTNKEKGRTALKALSRNSEIIEEKENKIAVQQENKPIKHKPETVVKALRNILENTNKYIYSDLAGELQKRHKITYSPRHINTIVAKNPLLKELRDENENKRLDFCESQLEKAIEEGNLTAVIFKLKTRGKSRGYTERQELTGKDGEAVQYIWNITNTVNKCSEK